MSLHSRVVRLLRQRAAHASAAGPLTLFLVEARPDKPVGSRACWDGLGREIVYDPAAGWPPLPPGGPHKLILGGDPDWV